MSKMPTRDRLVDAAIIRFYKEGFRNVGLDQIIADVGISKTAFYKHFSSKDELLLAALDEKAKWLTGICREIVWEKGGGTAEGQLRAVFDLIEFILAQDEFQGCIFVRAVMEFPNPNEPIFQAAAANRQILEVFVQRLAENCQVADAETLARKLCLIAEGAYVMQHVTGNDRTIEYARSLANLAIDEALGQAGIEKTSSTK